MKVEVLGPGFDKCNALFAIAEQAIQRADVAAELVKTSRIDEIGSRGVLFTPALVVDGEVKCSGKLPTSQQVAEWLRAATPSQG